MVRVPPDLDEATLQRMAEITGGRYYRATDRQMLEKIYEEIDQLEKTEMETRRYTRYEERFAPWVIAALVLLAVERALAMFRFGGVAA